MLIDSFHKTITFKPFEIQMVLRYVKYHIAREIDTWSFEMGGTHIKGRAVLQLGPLPGIPDIALTTKGKSQERELNELLTV